MDTMHLSTFLQAARRKNMSHAAEDLFMSPQALSKQITTLEKELGFSLIVRGNRGIELTEAGRVFAEYATKIVGLAQESVERGRMAAGLEASTLTLGTYHNASLQFYPAVMRLFQKLHPDMKLVFVDLPSFDAVDPFLRERRIKAAMTIGNSRAEKQGITYLGVGHQRAMCWVSEEDSLSSLNAVSIEDLRGKTVVVMARGCMHWSDRLCKYIKSYEPDIRIEESSANDSGGMLMWQPDTVGMTIRLITPSYWTNYKLVPFNPPKGISPEVSIDLAVYDEQDPSVQAFAEVARIVCRQQFME